MSSVTATQLTFTVTSASSCFFPAMTFTLAESARSAHRRCAPLASGTIIKTGTAAMAGVVSNASFGVLKEVAGAANRLAIQTQPSSSATAGVMFARQPVIGVQDKFGNLRSPQTAMRTTAP